MTTDWHAVLRHFYKTGPHTVVFLALCWWVGVLPVLIAALLFPLTAEWEAHVDRERRARLGRQR